MQPINRWVGGRAPFELLRYSKSVILLFCSVELVYPYLDKYCLLVHNPTQVTRVSSSCPSLRQSLICHISRVLLCVLAGFKTDEKVL